jgi:RNA polymerase sigma-70 factor (ECF subfamily)
MDESVKEKKLVISLIQGDRLALKEFIDNYGQFMYHVSYKILLSTMEAEEAAQDSVMKVLKSISKFDIKSSLKAWCYTIAYRTAIDYKRKMKPYQDISTSYDLAHPDEADDKIKEEELKSGVDDLLSHLDEESRLIVSLFYLEEKNLKEVVDLTGLTESNVKIKLFRARKEMANHVEKYFETV